MIGLYRTEVIRKDAPWEGVDDVEFATLDWVAWFNDQRLFGPIGDIPPAEFEQMDYQRQQSGLVEAGLNQNTLRETRSGSLPAKASAAADAVRSQHPVDPAFEDPADFGNS